MENILGNSLMDKGMDLVFVNGIMEINMKVNGKMESELEKVFFIIIMEERMKVNGTMIFLKAWAS